MHALQVSLIMQQYVKALKSRNFLLHGISFAYTIYYLKDLQSNQTQPNLLHSLWVQSCDLQIKKKPSAHQKILQHTSRDWSYKLIKKYMYFGVWTWFIFSLEKKELRYQAQNNDERNTTTYEKELIKNELSRGDLIT